MRETGPCRIALFGDRAAAAMYVGQARTLLGVTKNLAAQGGLKLIQRQFTLQGDVVISVQSVFGQDFISVTVPVKVYAATAESIPVTLEDGGWYGAMLPFDVVSAESRPGGYAAQGAIAVIPTDGQLFAPDGVTVIGVPSEASYYPYKIVMPGPDTPAPIEDPNPTPPQILYDYTVATMRTISSSGSAVYAAIPPGPVFSVMDRNYLPAAPAYPNSVFDGQMVCFGRYPAVYVMNEDRYGYVTWRHAIQYSVKNRGQWEMRTMQLSGGSASDTGAGTGLRVVAFDNFFPEIGYNYIFPFTRSRVSVVTPNGSIYVVYATISGGQTVASPPGGPDTFTDNPGVSRIWFAGVDVDGEFEVALNLPPVNPEIVPGVFAKGVFTSIMAIIPSQTPGVRCHFVCHAGGGWLGTIYDNRTASYRNFDAISFGLYTNAIHGGSLGNGLVAIELGGVILVALKDRVWVFDLNTGGDIRHVTDRRFRSEYPGIANATAVQFRMHNGTWRIETIIDNIPAVYHGYFSVTRVSEYKLDPNGVGAITESYTVFGQRDVNTLLSERVNAGGPDVRVLS